MQIWQEKCRLLVFKNYKLSKATGYQRSAKLTHNS